MGGMHLLDEGGQDAAVECAAASCTRLLFGSALLAPLLVLVIITFSAKSCTNQLGDDINKLIESINRLMLVCRDTSRLMLSISLLMSSPN